MSKSKFNIKQQRNTDTKHGNLRKEIQRMPLHPVCAAIFAMMPALAGADIIPDQNAGSQRPSMNQTANGTPLVNIADPNQRGISHNKFQSFNVGTGGVVFNNSTRDAVSAIGGLAMKNPNLTNQARAIVGEVTGAGRSSINGAMEVFGGKADLIIANPNGIQVNGGSTINANSLTLSTGKVLGQADGSIRLGVDGGTVSIDGAGLSTEGLTHFDIISRVAQVNGEIKGDADIKVVAGQGEYDPDTRTHTATAGATAVEPLAIDASALGSMYGGRIELIATDSGAGVRHEGSILGNNNVTVTADGDIVLGAVQSKTGDIGIAGRNVAVTGTAATGTNGLVSQGNIAIRALESVGVKADVVSENGTITIDAATLLQHAASILAMRGEAGTVEVPNIRINVGDYRIEGELYAVDGSGQRMEGVTVVLRDGSYVAVDESGDEVWGAGVVSTAQLAAISGPVGIKAQSMTVDGGAIVANDGTLEIDVAGMFGNSGSLFGASGVNVLAGNLTNDGVVAGEELRIKTGTVVNNGGMNGNLDLSADKLANSGVLNGDQIKIDATSLVNDGTVLANEATLKTGDLSNNGAVSVGGNIAIDASGRVENAGTIVADGSLTLAGATELTNGNGGWIQADSIAMRDIGRISNRNEGALVAVNGLSLDGIGTIENDAGVIQGNTVKIAGVESISNANGGVIQAEGDLDLDGVGQLSNTGESTVAAGETLTLSNIDGIVNDGAFLSSGGNLTIDKVASVANRSGGQIAASGDLVISNAASLSNAGATIYAEGGMAIDADAVENTEAGAIATDGSLTIQAQTFKNQGEGSVVQAESDLSVTADTIEGADGALAVANGNLTLDATTLVNKSGSLFHGENGATVNAADFENFGEGSQISSMGRLDIRADKVLNADGALLYGESDLSLLARNIRNANEAQIFGANTATVIADTISNSGSSTIATDSGLLTIEGTESITNDESGIVGGSIDLDAKQFKNANGGVVESAGNATIDVDQLFNEGSQVWANKTLDVHVNQDLTFGGNAGGLNAGDHLKVSTTGSIAVDDRVENIGAISMHADGDLVNRGSIVSATVVDLAASNITNTQNSLIWGMDGVWLNAGDGKISNERNGNILSQGTMSLAGDTIINNAGTIRSEGDMAIDARDLQNLSAYSGEEVGAGPESTITVGDSFDWRALQSIGLALDITLPTFTSNFVIDKTAEISAGGNLLINQRGLYSANATVDGVASYDSVLNEGGIISAGKDIYIKGNVVNQPKYIELDLYSFLTEKRDHKLGIHSSKGTDDNKYFDSVYAMLDYIFGAAEIGGRYDEYQNRGFPQSLIKQADGETLNVLMSTLFGPTWRAMSNGDLSSAWSKLKAGDNEDLKAMKYYILPQEKGAISAGGNVVHEGGSFTNGIGGVRVENQTIDVKVGDQDLELVTPTYDVSVNLKKFEELAMGISTLPALADLVAVNGMFQESTAWMAKKNGLDLPGSQTGNVVPMYETRLEFIDQSKFYGTDYFFQQIGYNPDVAVTVIGDNYFISELVRRQLNDAVGVFFAVRDGVQGEQTVKMLMDNAGTVSGLTVGQALTQEQMNSLETDIIWFVTESVNGSDVLVPRVYLSQATLAEMRDGEGQGAAIVNAGGGIYIDAESVHNASGSMVARGDITLKAKGDVVNISAGMNGGLSAGGNVNMISTKGNVVNNGASIQAGNNVNLIAQEGKVDITASVGYDASGALLLHEYDDAILAGNDVTVVGKDVVLNSGVIGAVNDITLIATEGSVQSNEMHEADSSYSYNRDGGMLNYTKTESTEATAWGEGSTLVAGGQLSIGAAEDIVLEGGNFVGTTGVMQAGNKVDVQTTTDYTYNREYSEVMQFGFSAGTKALGYEASASGGTQSGSSSYAGPTDTNSPGDIGQSNSSNGTRAGRASVDETASAKFGIGKTTEEMSIQSKTHENANLKFGEGGLSMEGKTVDLGGANVATTGALNVSADNIDTTKYVDEVSQEYSKKSTSIGVKVEGHSAIADAVNKYGELLEKGANEGNSTNAGMTALEVAGDISNVIFNDLAGGSVSAGIQHEKTTSKSSEHAENVNKIDAGSVNLQAKNDINLNGVNIKAEEATISAGGDVTMNAAKAWSESETNSKSFKLGVSAGASTSLFGAGVGVSVDFSGSKEHSTASATTYTNSTLDAKNVDVRSGGDTSLMGSNITGDNVSVSTGGALNIESVQDTYDFDKSKSNWGGSVGVAVAMNNGQPTLVPTVSGDGGGGSEFRDEHTTAQQAGISGKQLSVDTAGDLNLTGGHLIAESGQGVLNVGGEINAKTLTDVVEQDGGYGGGGGGISKTGLATVNAWGETIDEVHKVVDQKATIAGMSTEGASVNGNLNVDGTAISQVMRDEVESGNKMSFTFGVGDIADGIKGRSKKGDSIEGGIDGSYRSIDPESVGGRLIDLPKPDAKTPSIDTQTPSNGGHRNVDVADSQTRPDTGKQVAIDADFSKLNKPSVEVASSEPLTPKKPETSVPLHGGTEGTVKPHVDTTTDLDSGSRPQDQATASTHPDTLAKPGDVSVTPEPTVEVAPPAKPNWRETWKPTPYDPIVGSAGSATGQGGFNGAAKMNTNTGKDFSAIGDRGATAPKTPINRAGPGITNANGAPAKLSPGSSSGVSGFQTPTRNGNPNAHSLTDWTSSASSSNSAAQYGAAGLAPNSVSYGPMGNATTPK